jgi:translation initiation factor IF-3
MTFKGRQIAFKDDGMKKIAGIISKLDQEGLATVDTAPKFDGRNIIVLLVPKK